jgi:hypothetical protein
MPLSSAAFVFCHCHCLTLPLSLSTAVDVHCRHDLPLQPSLPLRVSAISCCLPLSIPFVVRHPILHAIVIRRCRCPPLPSSSAVTIFHHRSHHHHSAVFAISHRLLLSFPIAVRRPITRVVVIRHRRHLPPSLSAVAVPPLILPPTRC